MLSMCLYSSIVVSKVSSKVSCKVSDTITISSLFANFTNFLLTTPPAQPYNNITI